MERRIPKQGEIYKHFKNKLYQIVAIAIHSETGEELVIYQALYGNFKVYARPFNMFISEVDKEKYPEITQKYRFELVDNVEMENEKSISEDTYYVIKDEKKYDNIIKKQNKTNNDSYTTNTNAESGINPLLLNFLDANTYAEKNKIFDAMIDSYDEKILNDIAAVLDISTGGGSIEEQYYSIKHALTTLLRFECNKRG